MNKHNLSVLGLGLILLATSCKKTDVQHENPVSTPAPSTVAKAEWTAISNWSSSQEEKFTSFSATIQDSSISNAVTANGLVLVFSKNGNTINALPFQEKGSTDAYWYYQVSKGTITLSSDNYSGAQPSSTTGYKYIVFSPQQLRDLEAKGYSKIELMQLSHDDLAAILAK